MVSISSVFTHFLPPLTYVQYPKHMCRASRCLNHNSILSLHGRAGVGLHQMFLAIADAVVLRDRWVSVQFATLTPVLSLLLPTFPWRPPLFLLAKQEVGQSSNWSLLTINAHTHTQWWSYTFTACLLSHFDCYLYPSGKLVASFRIGLSWLRGFLSWLTFRPCANLVFVDVLISLKLW